MIKQGLLLSLLCCIITCGLGQSYYFRHYQVENGLSNNTVFSCVQDKRGFIWMGTKDGLNRFDGYTYKVFKNDPDDRTSIGDNFIRSIYIDAHDNLYAGTRNGLYQYNAAKENFSLIYKTNFEIREIKKDPIGNIWFISGQTLIRFNPITKQSFIYKQASFFTATAICIVNKTVWVAADNGTLQQYHPPTNSFTDYDIFNSSQRLSRWIEKLYCKDDSTILAGTSNYGVKSFNLNDHSSNNLLTYNADKTAIFARDFVQANNGELWIATESGIYILNKGNKRFTNLQKKFNNSYSISDNAVYCLCKDKEGGIWAGTYFGGINYFPKQYNAFEKYLPDYDSHSLSGNAVREICEDKYGKLWIGTEDAGLNKLDKKNGVFTQFKPTGTATGIAYPNIHGLLAREDELWIGTFEHGLDIMNIKTGKVFKHYPRKDSSSVLKSSFIVSILQTKKDEIYIGTRQGLYHFNSSIHDFEPVKKIPADCFVHTLMEDSKGLIWIGTMGAGLFSYDPATNTVQQYTNTAGNKNSISGNAVTTAFEDSDGTKWFGTEGAGLCSFDNLNKTFVNYAAKDGLPGNSIFKILEDGHKNLWITTSKGLVCFNKNGKTMAVYTTANGLISDQFNYNSGYKDKDGRMYFGSVKGLISFNPDSFTNNSYVAPVYITSIQSSSKELAPGISGTAIQRIELNYNQSSFSIDFAALSFTAPEMTKYQYMMQGLDNNWTYLTTNRKAYFTNLSAGDYIFKVKSANSSGQWSEATALHININPPFWASKWAYTLYVAVILAISYYLFNNYHNRITEKNQRRMELLEHQKETEIYQAKIDFFTNVAHEIKTPLTLIKAPLEKIMNRLNGNAETDQLLGIMDRNTNRLIELTNQLLDFRKIESNSFQLTFEETNITALLTERFNSFKPIAEKKKMQLMLTVPNEPVFASVDVDSIEKIFNNLFNNAVIYGQHKVVVNLYIENSNKFLVAFTNDGIPVPVNLREKIFEPFYRLKETQNKPGSGIGLALSKSLVTLHKGELYMQAAGNDLNIFIVKFPLHQK